MVQISELTASQDLKFVEVDTGVEDATNVFSSIPPSCGVDPLTFSSYLSIPVLLFY